MTLVRLILQCLSHQIRVVIASEFCRVRVPHLVVSSTKIVVVQRPLQPMRVKHYKGTRTQPEAAQGQTKSLTNRPTAPAE